VPPLLVLEHVVKHYGRIAALAGIDFAMNAGELVVLLGPNGAGKSTLVQLITGLLAPTSGTIRVVGRDLHSSLAAALANVGIVFQQSTLDLELSASRNLHFHAGLHGMRRTEARERVGSLLVRFSLLDREDAPARVLSGGNRRRLELARALLHRPKLLIMDEPTVGLDPQSRGDMLRYARELASSDGLGILWATHLIDETETADRIVVLHHGRVRFDGERSALLQATRMDSVEAAFNALTRDVAAAESTPVPSPPGGE
jgi:ABC-2 type transport system ATP-binding protein